MEGDVEFENETVLTESAKDKTSQNRDKNLNTENSENKQGDKDFQNKSDERQQKSPEFKIESESLRKMKEEMEKMRLEDERQEEIAAAIYKRDFKRERAKIEKETIARGYMFNPDIRDIKGAIAEIMNEERTFMLQRQIDALDKEEKRIQEEIDKKYGLLFSKEGRQNLTDLADKFFSLPGNAGLPEHISRSLTSEEIADLKIVFDMFDVKGKGYISATDLKKALAMLGFRASKAVLGNMISEVAGENKVRVTFENFLDFVVKSQGDGPDPHGEIKQAFEVLDTKGTGFLTLEDLREASSECSLNFSNTALREMIQEADKHGEGKISLEDFTDIMLQTSRFKFAS